MSLSHYFLGFYENPSPELAADLEKLSSAIILNTLKRAQNKPSDIYLIVLDSPFAFPVELLLIIYELIAKELDDITPSCYPDMILASALCYKICQEDEVLRHILRIAEKDSAAIYALKDFPEFVSSLYPPVSDLEKEIHLRYEIQDLIEKAKSHKTE
jgi:hypothetical protein